MPEARNRLDHDPQRDQQQCRTVDQRREDLPSQIAKGLRGGPRLSRQPSHEERQAKRAGVGQDMARVREQGQRVGQPSTHTLGNEDQEGQSQGDGERARRFQIGPVLMAVTTRPVRVAVPVTMAATMAVTMAVVVRMPVRVRVCVQRGHAVLRIDAAPSAP